LEHCFEQLEQFRTTKKIGLFEKWGATPKNNFFAFSALFFIFLNYNSGTI